MLDFPNAPTLNQKFPAPPTAGLPVYTWDGEKWTTIAGSPGSVGGSSQVYVGDTAPVGVADNSLWWESDTGLLYVRYNDGNSTAWIQIAITPLMDMSTVVLKAGDTMTGLLTLSGDPATALQAVTKRYVDAVAVLVRNHIAGLTISMPGGTGAFSVAPGQAADSTNVQMLALATALGKTTAAWAVGNGNGALDVGGITAGAFYHVFLIKRVDTGVVDVLISASATAPTLPSPYTLFRRIGSVMTGSTGFLFQITQSGDEFLFSVAQQDVNGTLGTTAVLYSLTVPSGIQVWARVRGGISNASTGVMILINSPDEAQGAANGAPAGNTTFRETVAGGVYFFGELSIHTNTSSQIRAVASAASTTLQLATFGWVDRRGKDA